MISHLPQPPIQHRFRIGTSKSEGNFKVAQYGLRLRLQYYSLNARQCVSAREVIVKSGTSWAMNEYRDRLKGLQILLSRTQAGPGRKVKQEQKETSRNHVPRLFLSSVLCRDREGAYEKQPFLPADWPHKEPIHGRQRSDLRCDNLIWPNSGC